MTTKIMAILLLLIFLLPLPIIEAAKYVYAQMSPRYNWYEVAQICSPYTYDDRANNVGAGVVTLFFTLGLVLVVGAVVLEWYDKQKRGEK